MLAMVVATEPLTGCEAWQQAFAAWAKVVWLGTAFPTELQTAIPSGGCFVLPRVDRRDAVGQLYTYSHQLLLHAWRDYQPKKASVIQRHAAGAAAAIRRVLNDEPLLAGLQRVAASNRRYQTGFFISPFAVSGRTWEMHFDRTGGLTLVHHPPGHTGHGPIVTIDGEVDQKYVALERREDMITRYGEPEVARWEAAFLEGDTVEAFLAHPPDGPLPRPRAPFYSVNRWYLPVLQPDYDARRDNLIVLDMTAERSLPFMLDELSLVGSRAPRLVVITQEARIKAVGAKTLFSFPISDLLILPSHHRMPIADLHLPLVLNAVGAALAGFWEEGRASETPGR
jgi:hypothetical protein